MCGRRGQSGSLLLETCSMRDPWADCTWWWQTSIQQVDGGRDGSCVCFQRRGDTSWWDMSVLSPLLGAGSHLLRRWWERYTNLTVWKSGWPGQWSSSGCVTAAMVFPAILPVLQAKHWAPLFTRKLLLMIYGWGYRKGKLNFCWIDTGIKSPKLLKREVYIYLDDQMQVFIFLLHFPAENIFLKATPSGPSRKFSVEA